MAVKDRLKNTLNKGPMAVSAQNSIIPDLSHTNTTTDDGSDNNIDNSPDTNSNNESVMRVQLNLAQQELTTVKEELVESRNTITRIQDDLDAATEQKTHLARTVEQLEAEKSTLQAELETARAELKSMSKVRSDLQKVSESKGELERQLASVTQQLEHIRSQNASEDGGNVVDDFATSQFIKHKGKKKTDTYKQAGFYQDNDIEERLKEYLKKVGYDKSTVINAAIDHLLSGVGI